LGYKVRVDGWLELSDAFAIHQVLLAQTQLGVLGSIAEIGVHHGKLFIWLTLHLRTGEKALALDLFSNQAENMDGSGRGNLDAFAANMEAYTRLDILRETAIPVTINSLKIPLCFFCEKGLDSVRFFSVDGGHFVDSAYEDCWTAFSALSIGGVIAVDDFVHGNLVLEGTLRFLYTNPNAKAFLISENKIYICQSSFYDRYFQAMHVAYQSMKFAKLLPPCFWNR
jgi:hypothetical protein